MPLETINPIHIHHIDPERRCIRAANEWRKLPTKQWELFTLLYHHINHVVPLERMWVSLWPAMPPSAESILRNHVYLLRRRLTDSPFKIITHHTIGVELIYEP